MTIRSAFLGVFVLSPVAGCHREPVVLPLESPPASASTAALLPFDAASFDPPAKAFVDAALAYAETCDLEAEDPTGYSEYLNHDVCSLKVEDVDPAIAAGKAFDSAVSAMSDMPVAARTVVDQIADFRTWMEGIASIQVSRGTMRAYQDLALAYNVYKPSAMVPTEPKHALDQYFVHHRAWWVDQTWVTASCYNPITFKGVMCYPTIPSVKLNTYDFHRRRGTPLIWHWGAQGPFITD